MSKSSFLMQVQFELKRRIPYLMITGFICNFLMLIPAFFLMSLYDTIIPSKSIETLFVMGLIVLVASFFLYAFEMMKSVILMKEVNAVEDNFTKLLLTASFLVNRDSYQKNGIVQRFDSALAALSGPLFAALFDVPFAPFYLIFLFVLHPVLGVAALIYMVFVGYLAYRKEYSVKQDSMEANRVLSNLNSKFERHVQLASINIPIGWVTGLIEKYLLDKRPLTAERKSSIYTECASQAIQKSVMGFVPVYLGLVVGVLILSDMVTIGVLFAANIVFMRLVSPMHALITSGAQIKNIYQEVKDVNDILIEAEKYHNKYQINKILPITLENVWVQPPHVNRSILRTINLKINSGNFIGVMGGNGAGKTTLLKTLGLSMVIKRGTMTFNAVPSIELDFLTNSPSKIGYVPQGGYIIDATVRQNIIGFNGDVVANELIWEYIKKFNLTQSILNLQGDLDAELSDYSGALSGGERQRLSIIRALVANPELILMDEPTSALDDESVAVLIEVLKVHKERGAAIVIATHDKRILSVSNRLVVMNNGEIVKQGVPNNEAI